MISAFFYLQVTLLKNQLTERLKRLKQPKYLFGALAGAGYFYFFFFRHLLGRGHAPGVTASLPTDLGPYLASFGGLILFVVVALAWVLPSGRAALQFSEAEVAFLFPAPLTRRRLIHFKLLRSQVAILISTLILTLIFRRSSALGGNALLHAGGWWLILSALGLHFTAASFARERLLTLGVHPNRRRAGALILLLAIVGGCGWWLRSHVAPPTDADLTDLSAIIRYAGGILQTSPVNWVLAPFALVVRPYFAGDVGSFLLAALPVVGVIALHYWWVIQADVAFEEASIDRARKQGERLAALRAGDWRAGRERTAKPRPPAFLLSASGPAATAFLWKNLTALGPFFRLRTWLAVVAVIGLFHTWASFTHLNPKAYMAISIGALAFGAWLMVMGPMIMRRDVRLMVSHFDLLKGYPLRGWQVILGSLLSPLVLLAAFEWLLLLLATPGFDLPGRGHAFAAGVLGVGGLGIALILPPLAGLMLSIPFAATLYFPAWVENSPGRGGGIEVMGQRLIFFAGYFIVLLVALLPAVICGGLAAFIVHWLLGTPAAVISTAVIASLVLSAEFGAMVWWLGERFERFDLSQELPR